MTNLGKLIVRLNCYTYYRIFEAYEQLLTIKRSLRSTVAAKFNQVYTYQVGYNYITKK